MPVGSPQKQVMFGWVEGHKAKLGSPFKQAQWLNACLRQAGISEMDWFRLAQNREIESTTAVKMSIRLKGHAPAQETQKSYPRSRNAYMSRCQQQFSKFNSLTFQYEAKHAIWDPALYSSAVQTSVSQSGSVQVTCVSSHTPTREIRCS